MTQSAESPSTEPVARRTVLLGAGAAGAAGLLAACSSGDTPSAPSASLASTEVPAQATAIAATADVPVGGGLVVQDKMVVVTQPSEGEFKAFTSTCTHRGCTVSEVTDTEIICPCHNSTFSATTGEVLQGPATVGLASVSITVAGGQIISQA